MPVIRVNINWLFTLLSHSFAILTTVYPLPPYMRHSAQAIRLAWGEELSTPSFSALLLLGKDPREREYIAQAHFLMVYDEFYLVDLVYYNLTCAGYHVACVKSGEEALAQAQTYHLDLVVLDLMLPGIDGLELCKRLKQDPYTATLPIIMLTAKWAIGAEK
jgi:PleD family two-component response regulator